MSDTDKSPNPALGLNKFQNDADSLNLPIYDKYAKSKTFVTAESDIGSRSDAREADELFLKKMYKVDESAELQMKGIETLSIDPVEGDGFCKTYFSKIMHTNTVDDNMFKMILNIAMSAWFQLQHDTSLATKLKSTYMLRTFFETPFHLRSAVAKLIKFDIQLCPISLFSPGKLQLLEDIDLSKEQPSYFIMVAVGLDNQQSTYKITTAPFDQKRMFGKEQFITIDDSIVILSDISSRGSCKHCHAATEMLCPSCQYTYFCCKKCYKSKINGHRQAVCARMIDIMTRTE